MAVTIPATQQYGFLQQTYRVACDLFEDGDEEEIIRYGKGLAESVVKMQGSGVENGLAAILEECREVFAIIRAHSPAPAAAPAPAKDIPEGTFTVVFPEGEYETVRIETLTRGPLAGKRVASYLSGQDNETDFTGFAFVADTGRVHVWKRLSHLSGSRKETAVRIITLTHDVAPYREAYAMRSGRCSRCQKTLTVPASLYRGLGPVCARAEMGQEVPSPA